MSEVENLARQYSGTRRARQSRPTSSSSSDQDFPYLVLILGAIAIGLYVRYKGIVLLCIAAIALVMLLIASAVVLLAYAKRVIADRTNTFFSFLVPIILCGVGAADIALLWANAGASESQRELLRSCDYSIQRFGFRGSAFAGMQLFAAVLFCIIAIGAIWVCLSRISAIYVVVDARPQGIWRYIHRQVQIANSKWITFVLLAFAAVSVLAANGMLYHWLDELSQVNMDIFPTPSLTP